MVTQMMINQTLNSACNKSSFKLNQTKKKYTQTQFTLQFK